MRPGTIIEVGMLYGEPSHYNRNIIPRQIKTIVINHRRQFRNRCICKRRKKSTSVTNRRGISLTVEIIYFLRGKNLIFYVSFIIQPILKINYFPRGKSVFKIFHIGYL